MPVPRGEAIDPSATRQRILSISERVFYHHGINAVGIAEIAEAASASKASIYKNFGSKEGLVEATLSYRSKRVHRWLADGTAHLAPGKQRVLGVFDLLIEWFTQDDFRGCAMISAAAEQRVSDPMITQLARRHLQAYRDFLSQQLRDADVRDPEQLASRLLILIEGATTISAIDGDAAAGQQARALAEELVASASQ
jgi:AcrR family transcriptional regulator